MNSLWKRVAPLEKCLDSGRSTNDVTEDALRTNGLQNLVPHSYQLEGIKWLLECHSNGHGCILGDDMGLGKTLQAIAFLLHLHVERKERKVNGPFLVLSPLSVASYWEEQFRRLTPTLRVLSYRGSKDERELLRVQLLQQVSDWRSVNTRLYDVFVSTPEMILKDKHFLKQIPWHCLVVDEGHRAKNSDSLFSQTITNEYNIHMAVLLTGTPVQNNLNELYSLLYFVAPDVFELRWLEEFVEKFAGVEDDATKQRHLYALLNPFLLRRCKADVLKELPEKSEVVLYCGLTDLQRKLYKAILTKDVGAFGDNAVKTRLLNIMMQLRKCCNHPYIFNGVEPEPFEQGDHLVTASGKLALLDQLLSHLKQGGHRVLIFSQMTRMLDILQDYLEYRGYCYERLDGSVRSEERYLAIKNFSEMDHEFVFLLSTRAGGVGLNLTAADTVIYADLDFNPQSDLQAAARVYRIGQSKPVKIIRLVTRSTVEEIIMKRADAKLKLSNTVIDGGHFTHDPSHSGVFLDSPVQLCNMLKFGLDKLLTSSYPSELDDQEWKKILGKSENGRWLGSEDDIQSVQSHDMEDVAVGVDSGDNIYMYEGRDYATVSDADQKALQTLLIDQDAQALLDQRVLRNEIKVPIVAVATGSNSSRKRKQLSEEELAARRQRRKEAAEKRAKVAEEEEHKRQEQRRLKLMKFWQQEGYESCNVAVQSDDSEDESDILINLENEDDEKTAKNIQFVVGDVTHPAMTGNNDAIIVHCVDDSGQWGRGGLFTAISNRSMKPQAQYELAAKMKDLSIGDCHIIPVDDIVSRVHGSDMVALFVAQRRSRHNQISAIKLPALEDCLRRLARVAKERKASVHLPRIGHSTPNFNWYGTERLIRKHLVSCGIQTFIYYFSRHGTRKPLASSAASSCRQHQTNSSESEEDRALQLVCDRELQKTSLPAGCLNGINVFLYGLETEKRQRLEKDVLLRRGEFYYWA
ncbi:chromodomain-helicase-DNA-binding protein 1-like isoform X2 [Corticium candelabrum]|uniref:chromodomain-helicase-DNA-binding protein 1-like isoform X2 n=1 Tax=Corticium candelabrum TaxID=121492 RepID=UPI002E277548|nr:chromodomain-helicase-DNA-binding protein 1-like isoform X2 [Corticium candelabrum]